MSVSVLLLGGEDPEALAETLACLGREDPGIEHATWVRAWGPCAELVRREHARRVRLLEAEPAPPGPALDDLLAASRGRFVVFLAPGARPAAGCLYELARVADETDAGWVGPRMPAESAEEPQGDPEAPPDPEPSALRRAANALRFAEPGVAALTQLSPACLLAPRSLLRRCGGLDPRYRTRAGALRDLIERARRQGAEARLARRASCWAPVAAAPADDDARFTARAESFAAWPPIPPRVFLELESDDPAASQLVGLANALLRRGISLHTVSSGAPPGARPADPPHLVLSTRAQPLPAGPVLLRRPRPPQLVPPGARWLVLPGEEPGAEPALRLAPPGEDPHEGYDAHARQVLGLCR